MNDTTKRFKRTSMEAFPQDHAESIEYYKAPWLDQMIVLSLVKYVFVVSLAVLFFWSIV